jgi:hypothetical protein
MRTGWTPRPDQVARPEMAMRTLTRTTGASGAW